jgi:hypothetical protein
MHDGVPLDNNGRQWRMIYIDPALVAREVNEETARPAGSQPPPVAARLCARSGNRTACRSCATARAPGTAASGQRSDARASSKCRRLGQPKPYDPCVRPTGRHDIEPLASRHNLIRAVRVQFRSRRSSPIMRFFDSPGRASMILRRDSRTDLGIFDLLL